MNYIFNSEKMAPFFYVPTDLTDKHIKLASFNQLKVLLFVLRHITEDISEEVIANALCISQIEVNDCLAYWSAAGFLIPKNDNITIKTETPAKPKKAAVSNTKPTREEIARMAKEDSRLQFLMREAQNKFGRTLRQNEVSLIAWLYADEGLPVSVIILLIEYAIRQNKLNIRYIENTAIEWINQGVTDLESAEQIISQDSIIENCWKLASAAFGLAGRKPSKKEKEFSLKWVEEWHFTRDILEKAYDLCIDTTGKYSASYIHGILERWHKNGVKTAADIKKPEKSKPRQKSGDFSAYDIELVNNMLNSED